MNRTTGVILIAIAAFAISTNGAVLRVPSEYPSIYDAYRSTATTGDTILVAPGIYEADGMLISRKSVSIISEKGAGATIINGRGVEQGLRYLDTVDRNWVLDGFTFLDCVGEMTGAVGFFNECHGTMRNCVVIRGKALTIPGQIGEGGGIRTFNSDMTITDCIVQDCYAEQGGGFNIIVNSDPIIKRCVVTGNEGAGIFIDDTCNPIIEDCVVTGNTGTTLSFTGGFCCYHNSQAIIDRCIIAHNTNANVDAGGIRIESSSPRFSNCLIVDNETGGKGGGILFRDGGAPSFYFCTIADNRAGHGSAGIATILNSEPRFFGCIIWNPAGDEFYSELNGTAVLNYCDCRFDFPGIGNFNEEPRFAGGGDYHLTETSPCIDRAIDYAVPLDMEAEVRFSGKGFDVGADEYNPPAEIFSELSMPARHFEPADICFLDVICHNSGVARENMALFVVLGVYGDYYFWPAWSGYDFALVPIAAQGETKSILPQFNWPAGVGEAENIMIYAGITNSTKSQLFGEISTWEMSWDD